MKRDELLGVLREPYSKERGFGVEKVTKTGYEHIWFVVPPAPPRPHILRDRARSVTIETFDRPAGSRRLRIKEVRSDWDNA